MSLINDALRRASHASKVSPPVGTPMALPPPPLPPAPPRDPAQYASPPPPPMASPRDLPPIPELDADAPSKSSRLQLTLSLLLVGCVLAAAGINYWQKNRAARAEMLKEAGQKAILADATQRRSNSNAVAAALAPPAPAVAATTAAPTSAAPVVVAVAAPAAPVVPVKFPPLRLQSIFYRPENASVIINNKTLFVHDEIQGVAVADIGASSVTLVLSGQTNVLTLR